MILAVALLVSILWTPISPSKAATGDVLASFTPITILSNRVKVGCGALVWDGAKFWCGAYDVPGTDKVYTVDKAGRATLQFTYPGQMDKNPESCVLDPANPTFSNGRIDGITIAGRELWVGADAGTVVYQMGRHRQEPRLIQSTLCHDKHATFLGGTQKTIDYNPRMRASASELLQANLASV